MSHCSECLLVFLFVAFQNIDEGLNISKEDAELFFRVIIAEDIEQEFKKQFDLYLLPKEGREEQGPKPSNKKKNRGASKIAKNPTEKRPKNATLARFTIDRSNPKYRRVVATEPIRKYDVIFVEDPLFGVQSFAGDDAARDVSRNTPVTDYTQRELLKQVKALSKKDKKKFNLLRPNR